MKKWSILGLMFCMSCVFSCLWVLAETPSPKTNLSEAKRWFHPRLSFQTEYNDNVFLEASDEQEDFMFITTPGIFLMIPFSGDQHLFTTDYHVDLAKFEEFDDQDYDNHFLLANLDLNFPRFFVKTYDDFRKTSLRADTEFTDRIERFENFYSFNLGSEGFNKFSFEAGYDYFLVDYRDDEFEAVDRNEHIFNGTAFYDLFPKTKALLEYNHAFIDYPDEETRSREGDYDQIRVGLTGELFQKMVGTVKVGYQNREYDDSQDSSEAVVQVSLTEYFSPHTIVSLGYDRTAKESVFLNNDFYFSNLVSVTLNQKLFFERLDGKLEFSYQNNEYDQTSTVDGFTAIRDDDLFGVQAGVDYAIRDWLTTGLEYSYGERDSNFGTFDYTDNRVLWKITAAY